MSRTRAAGPPTWPPGAAGRAPDGSPPPPASRTAVLTANVVVPTPPFGEKKVTISPAALRVRSSGRSRPARMRSASTRASSSFGANDEAMTSSAPASRNAIRASTSPAGATMRTGVGTGEAPRMPEIAPDTASPSATTRS